LTLLTESAAACDVCGCAGQGAFSGIYPQFTRNLVGIRYSNSLFQHPNTSLNFNGDSKVLTDEFLRMEAWTRIYLHPRIQFLASLPYQVHTRTETLRTTEINGVGDLSVTVNYAILQTPDSLLTRKSHTLLAGFSISLPTGPYQARDADLSLLPAQFQIGTGAYGFSPQLNYTIRVKGLGLNTDLRYTHFTENERSYQFGNRAMAALRLFYWFEKGQTSIVPHIGAGLDWFDRDTEFDVAKPETGGTLYQLFAGFDFVRPGFFIQAGAQIPLEMTLPESQPVPDFRLGLALGVLF
jgi:hypothetical protein